MKFLLPHAFKKAGVWMAPLGFACWVLMQRAVLSAWMVALLGPDGSPDNPWPYHRANVAIAIVSFCSFLVGLYFLTFSREKEEDEMVQRIRLESFQFAALVQLVTIITALLLMALVWEPEDSGLQLFFLAELFLFWITFILRFNFVLHFRLR